MDSDVLARKRASRVTLKTVAIVNQIQDAADRDYWDTHGPAIVGANQIQVTRDFAPLWARDADLVYIPSTKQAPAGVLPILLVDNATVANALGYHSMGADGTPLGFVFTATAKQYGDDPRVTLSHEILELLADPFLIWTASDDAVNREYALEVADPVEAQAYNIADVPVSNFVTPEWFQSFWADKPVKFDVLGQLTAPQTLARGGYCVWRVPGGPWRQSYGAEVTGARLHAALPRPGGRRWRRLNGHLWHESEA